MKIRAFNLIPGAVVSTGRFVTSPSVVTDIRLDGDKELATITFQRHSDIPTDWLDGGRYVSVSDYCDKYELVGLCRNPTDTYDTDFGTD